MTDQDDALAELLSLLSTRGYRFVTPTPDSHRRVLERDPGRTGRSLRDILGWSLPFDPDRVDAEVLALLMRGGAVEPATAGLRCTLRVSSLGEDLFLHSAFAAQGEHAVFFGPDTYRFAAFLERTLVAGDAPGLLVDVGAGAGPGALVAARRRPGCRLVLTDVNPAALRLAGINLRHAGLEAQLRHGSGFDPVPETVDLAVANPPYIAGETGATYSQGGDALGARLSIDWVAAGMARLAPGGRLLLYTGSAIVDGRDGLREALAEAARAADCALDYRELDVDVFGEELSTDAYAGVDRIAAVGAVLTRPG